MQIKLDFSNPVYVSASEIKCQVQVEFGDGSLFLSAGFNKALKDGTNLKAYAFEMKAWFHILKKN